jgi:hypothetical protein
VVSRIKRMNVYHVLCHDSIGKLAMVVVAVVVDAAAAKADVAEIYPKVNRNLVED